jgi:hypothetical protein
MGLAHDAIYPVNPPNVGVPRWQQDAAVYARFPDYPNSTYTTLIQPLIRAHARRLRNYENAVAFVLFGVHL